MAFSHLNGFSSEGLAMNRYRDQHGLTYEARHFPTPASKEVAMFRLMLSTALATGLVTAAFASPQNAPPLADQPPAAATAAIPKHTSPLKPGDRQCIRDTGSLIPAKKGQCLPVAGRSYSKGDIDATGETRLGPALERLDPAITVRGH